MFLYKIKIEDVMVLREPLVSGRQSPQSIGATLFLSIFIHSLAFYLEYSTLGKLTNYPNKELILKIHLWITTVLIVLSIIYAIPFVYRSSQKVQYLIMILVSQNFGAVVFYIGGLFLVGQSVNNSEQSLIMFTKITLLFAVLLFLATCIRFYLLIKKGAYRKGSKRAVLRSKFEAKPYITAAIISGAGIVFMIQYVVRAYSFVDFKTVMVTVLSFLIFYTMVFVLPEQLVILYCKFRFKSFNFDKRGYLEREE